MFRASSPESLTLRLFNYPAWEVTVNGQPVSAQTTEVTGQMLITVPAGIDDVRIHFRRTGDRTVGNWVSLLSLGLLGAAWVVTRPKRVAATQHA